MLSTLALSPMAVARSQPEYRSPWIVMLRAPRAAAPTPCNSHNNSSKLSANPQLVPATAKRRSDDTRIRLRPKRSPSTSSTGVSVAPGNVKSATSKPTWFGVRLKAAAISGKAGVMLETPSTAIRVTAKMT